jgi:two-component system response regulator DesR
MGGTQTPASPARPERPGDAGRPVIHVLVAEDVRVVRDTIVALLGLEADIEVAAAVASGDQIVPAALEHRPDVALLDIGLPGADGLTAAAELVGRLPGCRVLILTGLEASGHLGAAMRAGVCGFLLKDKPADELIGAVRAVARGERVVDPRLAGPACHPEGDPGQARWPGQGREDGAAGSPR